jgi:putative heme-binding domain-containing protein
MRNVLILLCFSLTFCLALPATAGAQDNAKPVRALLVLGGCCHDYANQQNILADGIAARANVRVTVAYDPDKGTKHLNPVYANKDWAKDYDVIIHDECSADVKDLETIENTILKPHKDGLPAVVLHCGMHCYRSEGWPKAVTPWFEFTGLPSTGHGAQRPIAITFVDKDSPITKGMEDWTTINEELYNNSAGKLLDTAQALARGKQGRDEYVVAWTNTYKGKTKVFGTTLGHNNETVSDARYLDLVTRGLLWSVGKLDEQHLKPAAKGKQAAAPPAAPEPAPARAAVAKKIAASLKAPEGFELTVFAAPPDVNYPTCLAAGPTGEVFVGIDEMGSLGRKAGRGRVLRCADTDGDGVADEFKVFAKMDHPRGLVWDGATRTLFVQHPPFLTAYIDDDGDGVADRSDTLVKGTANEKAQAERGADHTTNGIRLGIDGWIYIAMGDFGCTDAVGKDGTHLTRHGGGIVRVRTDGSGLEEYTRGQRNIYDVAIDPVMNAFTRDNTNDGDGWDVRLSYIVPTGNYGYPTLFKNFADETVKPMMDLGGGSPCGSLYVDEPNLPGDSGKMLYMVEWGRNAIMRHPLTPSGAGFDAKEQKWMDLPRGTDMDVDGQGHLFFSSWANGGFDYSGPEVGYVVRLSPKGAKPVPFPDLKKATDAQLVEHLGAASNVLRTAAQRELLARGKKDGAALARSLQILINEATTPAAKAAGVFTLRQLQGDKSEKFLAETANRNDVVREMALRALADGPGEGADVLFAFLKGVRDPSPRVRLVAAWGIGRFTRPGTADALLPLLDDRDPLVRHVAINSLVARRAADVAFRAISSSQHEFVRNGALVLQALHEPQVVDGLIERIPRTNTAVRLPLYGALCRLAYKEAPWDGGWWGTRPDTSGPYYKPAEWEQTGKIKEFLRTALTTEQPELVRGLVVELKRNRIDLPEAGPVAAKLAETDASFRQVLVDLLAAKHGLTNDDITLLRGVATSDGNAPAVRARAIRLLAQEAQKPQAFEGTVEALASVVASERPAPELESVLMEVARDGRFARQSAQLAALAESDDPARRELGYTFLLNLANPRLNRDRDRGRARTRESAAGAIVRAWSDPARAASLLRAIARTKADGYDALVEQRRKDPNPEVARAASLAADRLKLTGATAAKGAAVIQSLSPDNVADLVRREKGDPKLGAELFARQGCVTCHTVSAAEPPKGPPLAGIAAKYSRPELCESVLKPSAKIAQGFETQWFKTKGGEVLEGFVTREAGDEIEFRNATGVSAVLRKQDVDRRGKRDTSVMPEGLVGNLTPQEFAGLLAYLESLKGQ